MADILSTLGAWNICGAPDEKDARKASFFFTAAKNNAVESVQLSLLKGVPVDVTDENGWTALLHAVALDRTPVARLLLRSGANVNFTSTDGMTVMLLCQSENMMDLLQSYHVSVPLPPNGPRFTTSGDRGGEYEVSDNNASAAAAPPPAAATAAPSNGGAPQPSSAGSASRGASSLATRLSTAAFFNDVAGLRAALEAGANVNNRDQTGMTCLAWAANKGGLESVQLLLECGADMNLRNSDGWAPLHWAARSGSVQIVQMLLDAGADQSVKNSLGRTAAQMAEKPEVRALFDAAGGSPAGAALPAGGSPDRAAAAAAAQSPPPAPPPALSSSNPGLNPVAAVPLRAFRTGGSGGSLTSLVSSSSSSRLQQQAAPPPAPPAAAPPPPTPAQLPQPSSGADLGSLFRSSASESSPPSPPAELRPAFAAAAPAAEVAPAAQQPPSPPAAELVSLSSLGAAPPPLSPAPNVGALANAVVGLSAAPQRSPAGGQRYARTAQAVSIPLSASTVAAVAAAAEVSSLVGAAPPAAYVPVPTPVPLDGPAWTSG